METDHPDSHQETACQSAKPTHAAARQQQRAQGFFAKVLSDPEQFRPGQATEDASEAGIGRAVVDWKPATSELTLENPQADERANGDEDAETGDLELADAKQNRVDMALLPDPLTGPAAAPCRRYASDGFSSRPAFEPALTSPDLLSRAPARPSSP